MGVPPSGAGHSAKPEPVPVSAVPASVPNALSAAVRAWFDYLDSDDAGTVEQEERLLSAMRAALNEGASNG